MVSRSAKRKADDEATAFEGRAHDLIEDVRALIVLATHGPAVAHTLQTLPLPYV
jgi:hypothetical protein